MPPKNADQKKRRGRPPNASKTSDATEPPSASQDEPNELSIDADDAMTPPRRGRPSKPKDRTEVSREEESNDKEPFPATKPTKGNPGRRPAKEAEEEILSDESSHAANAASKRDRPTKSGKEHAREAPAQRKKRGRPSLDKKAVTEKAVAEETVPKKRGRKPKVPVVEAEAPSEEESEAEESVPKTRARKPKGRAVQAEEPVEDDPEAEETAPKKRGRKPKQKAVDTEEPVEEGTAVEAAPKRRRGRPATTGPEPDQPSPERAEAPAKKKRGRPSLQSQEDAKEPPVLAPKERRRKARQPSPAEEPVPEATKKRRKKPSKGEEPSDPSPGTQRRRSSRPKTSDVASPPKPQEQPPRKSKKRPPEEDDEAAQPSSPPKKRRRRTSDEQQQQQQRQQRQPSPAPRRHPPPKHRHIATQTRRIPRSTISEKWDPLAPSSVSLISDLLRLTERPVLQRLAGNEKRGDQAASAVRLVAGRIARKISRGLPFPPASAPPPRGAVRRRDEDAGRAEELDFERVVDGVASLEKQLDPLLHAIDLLSREKEREEKALEEDYKTLRTLEANARSEARNFKDSLRKTHVLVPERNRETAQKPDDADYKFVSDDGVGGALFKDLEDDELRGLAGQVGSHMESMRNNLQQIEGVVPQMERSRAALQDVLFKHLNQQNYENVLFG